jgi:hypothetical protein
MLFQESECWKLIKQQPIQWLQEQQMEEIHPRIITENESVEIDITRNLVSTMAKHKYFVLRILV